MKSLVFAVCCCAVLLLGTVGLGPSAHAAPLAEASLPRRDLTVELRQIEEGHDAPGSYSAGRSDDHTWEPQSVQVRNGEKALLRMNDAIPMQWTQSVSTQSTSATAKPQASVSNALVWFDAGQSLSVQAKWPGGNKPAVLVIEVQRAAMDAQVGAALPAQKRNTVSTTVTVPLAEWVTVAATGRAAKAGVYSSDAGVLGRRLLQVRVMAP
ncbi:hypothetical protein DIC66_12075 [Rhodoferax lacus]|uniref:Uncharacterized protein n=1 Tax=Rhodoferax lacus TaxID=2184758 RepID=A0A3E1RBK7_9BURK|nr:hypothetical protein [Rhodoferax lacus]RFO96744.1 hypothetical protein DIC66_12075 [Rhodoferax lacus]